MTKQEEFISQVELVLKHRIGSVIGGSVLKSNLAQLNKDATSMTKEDGKILVKDIIDALATFETREKYRVTGAELEKLLPLLD